MMALGSLLLFVAGVISFRRHHKRVKALRNPCGNFIGYLLKWHNVATEYTEAVTALIIIKMGYVPVGTATSVTVLAE